MIGTIPSGNKTFEVYGDTSSDNLIEGKLYYNTTDERLYLYSTKATRSNPDMGFFPIWNGKKFIETKYSIKKYLKDVTSSNISELSSFIDNKTASNVLYKMRRSESDVILKPCITDEDNFFTQCIKSLINQMELTMVDLLDMASPVMNQKKMDAYYSSLCKISFMRMDKWHTWISTIFHMSYTIDVYKKNKRMISFKYPDNTFDTGVVKYTDITKTKDDPFKKMIKILMIMDNVNKNTLKSDTVDDYTINNMMTTINGKNPMSAQLFSRYIHMTNLSFVLKIYNKEELVFTYKE